MHYHSAVEATNMHKYDTGALSSELEKDEREYRGKDMLISI